MVIPTIFDWIERFEFLRGWPAAYVVLLAAVVVVVAWDWRLALFALAGQYIVSSLLFVDVLEPRLAVVKMLVGLFVCLILYMTGRQTNWGRLPVDVTPAEAAQLGQERRLRLGPFLLPATTPLRLLLALLMVVVVWTLGQRPASSLPAVPAALAHVELAVYALGAMGLLGLALTAEPFKAGMGMLMFLHGFELYYAMLEQSVMMLALLAAVNLVVALAVALLAQVRHAAPALLNDEAPQAQRQVAVEPE